MAHRFFSYPSQEAYDAYSNGCLPLYSNPNAAAASAFHDLAIERPEVALHFFADEMAGMDMRTKIKVITCPTLVIGGTIDPVTPPICSKEIAEAIGDNAHLRMFEGCGHGPHRDDSDGAEKVMRSFLTNHI